MTDTEFNMVAKTTGPGIPPSTTAGSTGETVLNETTSFDGASEVFETVNPFSPKLERPRAHISSMTTGKLVNYLECQGANGGFVESMMSGEVTGACLLYTSPSPRDGILSRMPSSA